MGRIACLFVPDLPLQALVRADVSLAGTPLAVTEAPRAERGRAATISMGAIPRRPTPPSGTRVPSNASSAEGGSSSRSEPALTARVIAVSAVAAAAGARPGQTAAQARSAVAHSARLIVRVARPEQVAAARAALLDAALGFAPRVEPRGDAVFLEVGDLGQLFATERELALALKARAARVGLEVGVGIAAGKGVARVAASVASRDGDAGEGIRLVARGGEAAFLGPLPIAELGPGLDVAGGGDALDEKSMVEALEALARWGVADCARLAKLPDKDVTLRLGAIGARLHRLAAGRCDALLAAHAPPDEIEEGVELDFTILDLEALGFVLRGLVDRLLARLRERRLACAGLGLRLRLEDRGQDARDVPVAAPTMDAASLLTLVRLDVERRPPSAGVTGVTLSARAACARPDQLDLFRPAGPAPIALATTVAKLQALLGEDAVGAPRAVDTHREEEIAIAPFSPHSDGRVAGREGGAGARGGISRGDRGGREIGEDGSKGAHSSAMNSDSRASSSDQAHSRSALPDLPTSPISPSKTAARVAVRPPRNAQAPRATDEKSENPASPITVLGFRRFRPAPAIEVLVDWGEVPRAMKGHGVSCRVLVAAGPFRAEGEWWSESAFARDYWDVHATDGALYRIYCDAERRWFLAGYYD